MDLLQLETATQGIVSSSSPRSNGTKHQTTGLPPAVPDREGTDDAAATGPVVHPSIPLRFADVVRELEEIAEMASESTPVEGGRVAEACRRAGSLLRVLRAQFFQDVVAWDGHSSQRPVPAPQSTH
jgi:hypothetical protein